MAKELTTKTTNKREEVENALQELLELPSQVNEYTNAQAIALIQLALAIHPDSPKFLEYLRMFQAKK